ncbi:MAG TPA: GNAT family N-acetyltransferase [Mycobacteriales bacterium]|jgi:ribosomal protein S18 acetylase RimI-like enzyme|nr:GNAT family N-acetyltransferase [Mycobacteriales bacterium]
MTQLAQLDGMQMRAIAGPAASVYGAAMKRSPEVVVQRREIIAGHTSYPGFLAAGAFDTPDDAPDATAGELVGFGYGYLGAGGQWWHDTVAHALGRDGTRRWLRGGFELAELHVLPAYQGAGLGRRLLTDVLSRTTAKRAVLSTPDTESPARLLYRSAGFEDLVCGFYFPGSSECYAIMGADL